ncbi:hypothetical protein PanWU01x14_303420, partial [Parasponia andersonii]
ALLSVCFLSFFFFELRGLDERTVGLGNAAPFGSKPQATKFLEVPSFFQSNSSIGRSLILYTLANCSLESPGRSLLSAIMYECDQDKYNNTEKGDKLKSYLLGF